MPDSTANITKAAQTRDIELGILFSDSSIAKQITEFFQDLTEKEILSSL